MMRSAIRIRIWAASNGLDPATCTATMDGERIVELNGSAELAAQAMAITQAELDAYEAQAFAAAEAEKKIVEQDLDQFTLRQRAIVAVLVDEINALRGWLSAYKSEVAAATSLADLQTRTAALPAMPDRTGAQAKTAIANKVEEMQRD